MKYAVRYTHTFTHYDEVDEVIFPYYQKEIRKNEDLITFIPSLLRDFQHAIVDISDARIDDYSSLIPILKKIHKVHPNLSILINYYSNDIKALKKEGLKYIFIPFASNYEMFYSMAKLGASEIYIVEELAFDLKNLQSFRQNGIKIRVFPDIAQSYKGTKKIIPEITKFWIRPEDVDLYSNYVDTIEFCRCDNRLSTVFEIYKQKQWMGNIKDLILDYNENLPNTGITPYFGHSRIDCRKKCMINQCNICMNIADLAKVFNQSGLEIIQKRSKNEKPYDEELEILNSKRKERSESETN